MKIKAGDTIRYTSAAGTQLARVDSISIGPTAKPNHSIAWLNLTVFTSPTRKYESSISIPADVGSLAGFKVQVM